MSKEIYISSTPHETRLAIVEKDELTEIYYERENEYTLAGSIYNGRVTRVLPGMQSSFVDIGLERDAFLYITDFMEEAGDSADFDAGEGRSNDSKRGGEGRGRPGRSEESRGEEGTAGASGAPGAEVSARGNGEGRHDRSERGDRNRGGRGKREERPRGTQREGAVRPVQQGVSCVQDEQLDQAPREADEGELGESAPGADEGRRWRGRRGRRRGRGGSEEVREGAPVANEGGEAAADQDLSEREPEAEAAPREIESQEHGGRERGGREGRGDSQRGREQRGGRGERGREGFGSRGGRGSSRDGEAREEEGVDLNASAEPMILPGESLSKYRRGAEGEASGQDEKAAGQTFVTPKPSTEVVPLAGWDGGATLPGETLSRQRGSENRGTENRGAENRGAETRGGSDRKEGRRETSQGGGGERRRERDAQRGRGEERGREGRSSFRGGPRRKLDPAEAVLPAVTSQHEVEPANAPFSDDAPAFETQAFEQELEARAQASHEELQAESEGAPAVEAAEEFHETVAEYEPEEEASASYRVDPVGPSEFRQSAPVDDLAEIAFEDVEEHEAAPAGDGKFGGPSAAPQDDGEKQATAKANANAELRGVAEEIAPEHEFTSVQPGGEMISEAAPVAHAEAAPLDAEMTAQVEETVFGRADAGAFAPGDGELEEELIDEDEGDVPELRASAFDDDMEEETLEGAADLGTMLREMSIDQITRPEEPMGEMDEDDDFDIDEEEIDHDEFEAGDEIAGSDVSEAEEDDFAEAESVDESAGEESVGGGERAASSRNGEGQRRGRNDARNSEGQRRDGRRGGRDRGGREGGSREGGSRDKRGIGNSRMGGRGRQSMQATDLPAISDLLKPGQEVLVQIAKEPIAKKGARITSHIALPGRFLVFMPTVGHVGVSRKIESEAERRRLKDILLSERGEASGGLIVRTAAAGASEEELRSDLRFLLNLWTDIKQRSESSKSPALIYHDLNLVERILRDQVTDNFSAIWVDTETEYERVLRFLQRFQPSLIRRVKLYTKETPLFEQFGISAEIDKALRSKVWLKSGGSIVINQTEALVAIDINTGKFVGKTARLEDTIVKTNLDAIPEIVRQIRLRDLGGIIIIDFIDMDERRNRNRVMAALEEELKSDRAPSKVLQFNDFGLVAITRKRVKQSLERTLSTTCGVCAGTGMVKSPVTVCNDIYIEMRKMHKHLDKGDIMLRVNPEVVKQLKTGGGKWLQEMEEMSGKTILVKSDPALHPEQFDIH